MVPFLLMALIFPIVNSMTLKYINDLKINKCDFLRVSKKRNGFNYLIK